MTPEEATRLYYSAERAVKEQFPHLSISDEAELVIDELEYRFGLDMAFEIITQAIEL